MKSYSAVVLALAAAANAVQFTNPSVRPEPGKPFELTWSGAEGPVTILLKTGPSDNLETVEEVASGVTGDSTEVTLDPKDLPSGNYAFEISDGKSDVNYSVQFAFNGEGKAEDDDTKTKSGESTASASASATESSSASTSASKTASSSESSKPTRTSSPEEEEDKDVPDSGSAHNMSPLAFVFVTAAAMLYFN